MGSNGKEAVQRTIAILVIIAMLSMMGIPPTVIIFFAVVVFFVWRAVQRSEQQDIRSIFDFYIAANEILRDEERRWYGFEIAEAIERGDHVVRSMFDPPPLVNFTLGALYNRAGDHEAAVDHLSYVVENEQGDESRRFTHSPELQRYVQVLRRLEREPAEAPQTMSAIRSLERQRRVRAAQMLDESRRHVQTKLASIERTVHERTVQPPPSVTSAHAISDSHTRAADRQSANGQRTPQLAPPAVPPPISELLRDLYEEEKKTA